MASPGDIDALRTAWQQTLPGADAVFADLVRHYREPRRAYHNTTHLRDVLAAIDRLAALPDEPRTVRLAAWFHDVIYDPQAQDNEERSAAYATAALGPHGIPAATLRRISDLILLTKTHAVESSTDRDASVLLDADLAILGAAPAQYDAYARAIRQEYAWVPDEAYRSGRRAVLERFLQRPRLYHTALLFAEREAAARANLRREIAALISETSA